MKPPLLTRIFDRVLLSVIWWHLTNRAVCAKSWVEAIQESGNGSSSDPSGYIWMLVCVGLLVIVAGSLIVATIGLSSRKKKADSGK